MGHNGTESDGLTNSARLLINASEPQAILEYRINGGDWSTDYLPVEGYNSVEVRQTDLAGNSSNVQSIEFTLDTVLPDTPIISLEQDTGTGGNNSDGITSNSELNISGTDSVSIEYSMNGGAWSGQYQPVEGDNSVRVRFTDNAGNVPEVSEALNFTLDTTILDPVILVSNGEITIIEQDADAVVEYSIDNGVSWQTTLTTNESLTEALVRQIDTAGNISGEVIADLTFQPLNPQDDSFEVPARSTFTSPYSLLNNDTGAVRVTGVVTQPSHGTVTIDENGFFTYTHTEPYNFRGHPEVEDDFFVYRVEGPDGEISEARVDLNVEEYKPVAGEDIFVIREGESLTVQIFMTVFSVTLHHENETLPQ